RAEPGGGAGRRLLRVPAAHGDRPVPGRGVRRGDPPRRGARAHRAGGLVGFGAVPVTVTPLPAAEPRPRRVAMGMFDGVHLGHRAVIEGSDTVLTFDPHPLRVIHPEAAP